MNKGLRPLERTPRHWRELLGISVHIKDKTIEEVALFTRNKGVPYLEIVAERFWGLPEERGRWQGVRDLLQKYNLRPLFHSSYIEINMASINHHLREAALRQNLLCLELGAFLRAGYMIVHAGNLNRNYPTSFLPEARRCLLDGLRALVSRAEALHMTIALENGWNGENHPLINSADEHAYLIETIGSPALRAIFDIGHANTFEVDLMAYLERLRPHLAGIHIHDNDGSHDQHLPLGEGTVGEEVLRACFSVGVPVVLEMNSLRDISVSLDYLEAIQP